MTLIFFWLESFDLAIQRVKNRVEEGGHNIPEKVIIRRYYSGIKNLFGVYYNLPDITLIYDNSSSTPILIAEKELDSTLNIKNIRKFESLINLKGE